MGEPWYHALRVVARHGPLAFWRLTDGAAFWWCPDVAELLPNGFATQPFSYAEVESVTVFSDVWGDDRRPEDWPALRAELCVVAGLRVRQGCDVTLPPARPPNRILHLSLQALPGESPF